jgi:hypothetical protein
MTVCKEKMEFKNVFYAFSGQRKYIIQLASLIYQITFDTAIGNNDKNKIA